MARLKIINLTKKFGDVIAVNNMNLVVEEGEFMTLLGPSGCGKTTSLRLIAGFIQPDEGEIYFDDQLINTVPDYKRFTAMVFQSYALFPHMSVRENVRFGLRMQKIPLEEQNRRIKEVINMVNLNGMENRMPNELSGGQQQRVALARAVVTQPKLLLFDEPLSNLDAKLREHVRVEIRDLQKRLKITSIYVTHDQEEALVLSDRIAVMNTGHIEQISDSFSIYRYPKTKFVADFIGHANIYEGEVVAVDGEEIIIDTDFGRLYVKINHTIKNKKVFFSWRPEDMILYKNGMRNKFNGKVTQFIFMGNISELFVDVNGIMCRVQIASNVVYQKGEAIILSVPEEKICILI
jgi:ABC-type Fe3+/spermidine/putrescine transport system ATPase subunit